MWTVWQLVMDALGLVAQYGGAVFCLYVVAFRWDTLCRKYGRIDLGFWVNCIVITVWFFATLTMQAIWAATMLYVKVSV